MESSEVWLVTGSSKGFGLETVEYLLTKPDTKVIATLRNPHNLADLSKKYSSDRLIVLKLDVTNKDEVKSAFDAGRKHFGRIDVVYSNAGVAMLGEIESTADDDARWIFETNFWGASHVALEAMSTFRDFNKPIGGRLLHMSSYLGTQSFPAAGWYGSAKAAGDSLIETLSNELDPAWNIKINILTPSWFVTPMTQNPKQAEKHPAYKENKALPSNNFPPVTFYATSSLAKLIYKASKLDNAPLKLVIGKDAVEAWEERIILLKEQAEFGKDSTKELEVFVSPEGVAPQV